MHVKTLVQAQYVTHNRTHGLHVNYRGERRRTYLIAESICCGHMQGTSPMLQPLFFCLKSKTQWRLTYSECNNLNSKAMANYRLVKFCTFYKNISGQRSKSHKLINYFDTSKM